MEDIDFNKLPTITQAKLYYAIKDFIEENGFSPTIRELNDILGKHSPGTIYPCLKILKRKGYIDFAEKKYRTIRITKELELERVV